MASTYYKVSDPVMAVQISWMMEVPQLYRQCYDKPFQLDSSAQNPNIQGGSASYLLGRPTRILKDFLKEKEVTRFRPYDVQDVLQPQVSRQPQRTTAEQEPEAGPSSGTTTSFKQPRELLQKSLQILQDEGLVFHKVKSQDEVYHVTERDKDLLMAIRDILREDCRREKCKGISPLTPFEYFTIYCSTSAIPVYYNMYWWSFSRVARCGKGLTPPARPVQCETEVQSQREQGSLGAGPQSSGV